MELINCTHLDIFKLILKNKEDFESFVQKFFSDTIRPLFINNGSNKLRLICGNDHAVFVDGAYPSLDIISYASTLSGGGQFYQQAFLYYLSTDLQNWTKYFHKSDLNG